MTVDYVSFALAAWFACLSERFSTGLIAIPPPTARKGVDNNDFTKRSTGQSLHSVQLCEMLHHRLSRQEWRSVAHRSTAETLCGSREPGVLARKRSTYG